MNTIPRTQKSLAVAVTLGVGAMLASFANPTLAGPFVPGPTISATPTTGIPAPPDPHPGKEYSHELDKNASAGGPLDDSATILFDGAPPGGVTDGFDYDGADTAGSERLQVDAMANVSDALFTAVRDNLTALAVSFRDGAVLNSTPAAAGPFAGVQGAGVDVGVPIHFETTGGLLGPWATVPEVDQHGVRNLDGLEIWGGDGVADGNRYSLFGDSLSGTAIYNHITGGPDTTYLSHAALLAGLFGPPLPEFVALTAFQELMDIDALMVNDGGGSSELFDDPDDWIMFSLWGFSPGGVGGVPPGPMSLTGDAIYVWNFGSPIVHLMHGGHTWFDGWTCRPIPGAVDQCLQVDAMEALAVPAPASLGLLGIGLAGLGFLRRRRTG